MKYDFHSLPKHDTSGSAKWYFMYEQNEDLPADIVPLSVADMELKTAPEIIEGLTDFIREDPGFGYTIPTPKYFFTLMAWMRKRHDWLVSPDWVVMSPGVVPALYASVKCFAKEGEGVIIFSPVYYPFKNSIEGSGRRAVEVNLLEKGGKYEIDWEAFEKTARSKNNKILMFCSPHNPVGRVWTKEELSKLSKICLENDILVLSDEIHHDLIMPGFKHTVYATLSEEAADNCLIFTAPSKTFNLAGLQASNVIIPNPLLRKRFKEEMEARALKTLNTVAFQACRLAYEKGEAWLGELILHIDKNRRLVEDFMKTNLPMIKTSPLEGTYLHWWDCRKLNMDCSELENFLRNEAHIFANEGHIFGDAGGGFVRINLACPSSVIETALVRFERALKKRIEAENDGN